MYLYHQLEHPRIERRSNRAEGRTPADGRGDAVTGAGWIGAAQDAQRAGERLEVGDCRVIPPAARTVAFGFALFAVVDESLDRA